MRGGCVAELKRTFEKRDPHDREDDEEKPDYQEELCHRGHCDDKGLDRDAEALVPREHPEGTKQPTHSQNLERL